jgi:BirA family transcriptional regulator, biotin operon repressor / biotin---[acetyl-CoA-carboxylase] ligase
MKTLFVGQNSIHVESVGSTNSYASEMMRQIELSEGSVIYSFSQLSGRGQRGNFWESEPNKNMALSIVLYPRFLSVDMQFLLTKMTSLAVSDLMAEILRESNKSANVSIKWPNDIYVNDKKIAGILIENTLKETSIQSAVIGIGINVNQKEFNSTKGAVSLITLVEIEMDLQEVLERLCEFFEARYLQLKSNKLEHIDKAYLDRLYRIETWADYRDEQGVFQGRITGVSANGKLQLELKSGEVKSFGLKEIGFI